MQPAIPGRWDRKRAFETATVHLLEISGGRPLEMSGGEDAGRE